MSKTQTVNSGFGDKLETIDYLLQEIQKQLKGPGLKASLTDYIRLVQFRKELDEEQPREVQVTWVEPSVEQDEPSKKESAGRK